MPTNEKFVSSRGELQPGCGSSGRDPSQAQGDVFGGFALTTKGLLPWSFAPAALDAGIHNSSLIFPQALRVYLLAVHCEALGNGPYGVSARFAGRQPDAQV